MMNRIGIFCYHDLSPVARSQIYNAWVKGGLSAGEVCFRFNIDEIVFVKVIEEYKQDLVQIKAALQDANSQPLFKQMYEKPDMSFHDMCNMKNGP
jgi:hypothetical protein